MKLSDLLSALSLPLPKLNPEITGITADSSSCQPGSLFVCIDGMHRDGHRYIAEAAKNGATAFLLTPGHGELEKQLQECGSAYAVCEDTRSAEAILTSRFCGDPWKKMKLFAVTGTNGKTTLVSMLNAIYTMAGYECRTIGTLTGKLTTPDPAELYTKLSDFAEEGVQYVFMEISSHALALGKLAPITFDCGIFTNLTPEHLDFHGSMQSYAASKAKLFRMTKRGILNADDKYCDFMLADASCRVFRCSAKQDDADFSAKNIVSNGIYGIQYDLMAKDRIFRIKSGIPGAFTVMNTLEAASAALTDGISVELIRGALCGFRGVKGRLERVQLPTNEFSVYIDFAHTPDALENILRTVRGFLSDGQRLVLLFGCGGDRDKTKRPVMGAIASQLADYVIVTADNSRTERTADIISQILSGIEGGCPYTVIENRREAIEYAISSACPGDVILLAGKGHEEYEIMPDGVHPFSERAIVEAAVEKHIKSKGLY